MALFFPAALSLLCSTLTAIVQRKRAYITCMTTRTGSRELQIFVTIPPGLQGLAPSTDVHLPAHTHTNLIKYTTHNANCHRKAQHTPESDNALSIASLT